MDDDIERTKKVTANAEKLFQAAHRLAADDTKGEAQDISVSLMIAAVSIARMTDTPIEKVMEQFTKLAGNIYGYAVEKVEIDRDDFRDDRTLN